MPTTDPAESVRDTAWPVRIRRCLVLPEVAPPGPSASLPPPAPLSGTVPRRSEFTPFPVPRGRLWKWRLWR